jgi:hypothetical protein
MYSTSKAGVSSVLVPKATKAGVGRTSHGYDRPKSLGHGVSQPMAINVTYTELEMFVLLNALAQSVRSQSLHKIQFEQK